MRLAVRSNLARSLIRLYSEGAGSTPSAHGSGQSHSRSLDVPGLSPACIEPASQPVGPGVDPKKTGAYKVPEYFCYNNMSYFEAEIEMSKMRCEQPSALKK